MCIRDRDILAAIGVVLNGIPQVLLALSMGFAAVPTALGFGVGVIGCLLLGSVAVSYTHLDVYKRQGIPVRRAAGGKDV